MSTPSVLPPSPPSTSSRRKLSLLKSLVKTTGSPESPASFPGSSNSGSRKRVEFSPWTSAHESAHLHQQSSSLPRVKSLPPSSECQSSLKSILKPLAVEGKLLQSTDGQQDQDRSTSEMMESIVNQLSQDDRALSVDAYRTLASVIREYDDIPEEAVLKSKINTIIKYIKRDLLRQIKPDEPHIADTNLMTQALKVLVIFVWSREYSSLMSDEHRVFILDRSIHVVTEHTAPKSVMIHYLHLLATQDFRHGLLNSSNRVPRLLEALKALPEHVKGNGILSERLLVYQKLLEQARAVMKAKANLWTEELLIGMTHPLKDVRDKAMNLGLKACVVFPASSSIASVARPVLERELEPRRTFSSAMCRRLEKMISTKEEVAQVPQIWAIVILLSNGLETRVDNWAEMKDWLKVIQRCFNCSESAVRQQSIAAWNRLVYVVRPHEASDTFTAMLAKPLVVQLERSGSDKGVKSTRATAVSSYCNLLYYAFRPAATHKQYTRVWNEYIVKVMRSSFFDKNSANSDLACRVLISLLWNSNRNTKVWNENRALENTPVEPEELPTIDCKWVRARSLAVVEMFRVLLRYSSWGGSGQSDRAYIAIAWTHFLKALREASSKEVKASSETKQATAIVADFLASLWAENSMQQGADHSLSEPQLRQMTRSAIFELGTSSIANTLGDLIATRGRVSLFAEILVATLSELKEMKDNGEFGSHVQSSKIGLQALIVQYNKCLRLLDDSMLHELQKSLGAKSTLGAELIKTIVLVLTNAPEQEIVQTFRSLTPSLVLLLKDEKYQFNNSMETSFAQVYQTFTKTTASMLTRVPPTAVAELDEIFAAFFESANDSALEVAGEIWDKYFVIHENITLGPRLSNAIERLAEPVGRESAEVQRVEDHHQHAPSPLRATDIREDASPVHNGGPTPGNMESTCGPSPILGSQGHKQVVAEDHLMVQSSPTKSYSRPRSRHNDSQIDFVPIDSSPPADNDPESQFLTAHQKEVRDRQRSEPAVVFPDLRSSPKQHSKSFSHGDCEFARKAAALEERPSTPTLPTSHDQEAEVMASPTPRARHSTKNITDIEVPSSPPSMVDHAGDNGSSPLPTPAEESNMAINLALQPDVTVESSIVNAEQIAAEDTAAEEAKTSAPVAIDAEGPRSPIDSSNIQPEVDQSTEAPQPVDSEQYPPSTVDETLLHVDDEQMDAGTAGNPRTDSDEIDMLSASQLSQDLDRHLSQVVEDAGLEMMEPHHLQDEESASQSKPQRSTRKRKAIDYTLTKAKRRRSKASSQISSRSVNSQQTVLEASNEDDCIEVAPSQPVQVVAASTPVENAQSVEPTPTPKTRRGRARRRTRHSQSQEPHHPEVGIVVSVNGSQAARLKEEMAGDDQGVDVSLSEYQAQAEDRDVAMDEAEEVVQTSVADQTESEPEMAPFRAVEDEAADVQPVEASIMSSLHGVLDRLKSSKPGDIDLRAVDDLCFQIRFQAQVVAQQNAV
ncbi:hypothetical protein H2202_000688 [Exophiala xenobiotica]|nr:hypothetical protein H2202_000688 [Exophiala xenobiotica]KAK5210037.1 hypothetical protein LTR41_004669 [Exophiala xenobiotica]KAK5225910.1 hypothetical protein LTR72_003813 [Exophiala xenobiotica]KAK5236198.1 hypothetical protein LTR47_002924 [Exophiala xenobiotica]KAK5255192.1 hypothetical protein LTS06_000605 [Exophiala xenobiotica]